MSKKSMDNEAFFKTLEATFTKLDEENKAVRGFNLFPDLTDEEREELDLSEDLTEEDVIGEDLTEGGFNWETFEL